MRLCHTKIHAARTEREIELEGPRRSEQRARLRELLNGCLMHRTLASRIVAQTTLRQ